MAMTQEALREKYTTFYRRFHSLHKGAIEEGSGHRGHGPDHDMLVAGYCLLIAGDDHRLAEMAWVAAHLHSFDRFAGDGAEELIDELLSHTTRQLPRDPENEGWEELPGRLPHEDILLVKTAVMRHDKPNADDDSMVQIVLQDADRLANLMPYVIARSGQFQPDIPVVEIGHTGFDRHPESTYKSPRSIHDDLLGCLEWHPDSGTKFAIRTPKAREIGGELFAFLRDWFAISDRHMKMAGL